MPKLKKPVRLGTGIKKARSLPGLFILSCFV